MRIPFQETLRRTSFQLLVFLPALTFLSTASGFPVVPSPPPKNTRRQSVEVLNSNKNDGEYALTIGGESAQAGKDGYSVLRQPLLRDSWDPTLDPKFDAPKTLQEENSQKQNMDWWSDRKSSLLSRSPRGRTSISDSTLAYKNGADLSRDGIELEDEVESLDLFQRSLDTLDFPFVLRALRRECFTAPGQKLADDGRHTPSETAEY